MEEELKVSNDSSDFVLLSDIIPDIIQEIRYYSSYNFIGNRIPGYEEPIALLTKEAAYALKEVNADLLKKGYRLKVFDAYRPKEAVDYFVEWSKDMNDTRMKKYFYPNIDKDTIFKNNYLSRTSAHNRGSAVDLTIVDMKTGKEIDMGGPFDLLDDLSHVDCKTITEEQYNNRMFLRNTMTSHGFKAIMTEWWHFKLENEPFPDTYFTFPVSKKSINK